jgi:hypothetical protein
MSELEAAADELLILPKGEAHLHVNEFDEDSLSELVVRHFRRKQRQAKPMLLDGYSIYMSENSSAHPES